VGRCAAHAAVGRGSHRCPGLRQVRQTATGRLRSPPNEGCWFVERPCAAHARLVGPRTAARGYPKFGKLRGGGFVRNRMRVVGLLRGRMRLMLGWLGLAPLPGVTPRADKIRSLICGDVNFRRIEGRGSAILQLDREKLIDECPQGATSIEQMERAKSHTEQGQIRGNCAKTIPQGCRGEMRIPIMFRFVVRVVGNDFVGWAADQP